MAVAAITPDSDYGTSVEAAVRQIGAVLGMPDFVFLPAIVRKGSATREVGDGFLVTGDLGAIIQVKSRLPDAAKRDEEQAESKVRRMVEDAVRQANGTRREIARRHSAGLATHVVPLRAVDLPETVQERFVLELPPDAVRWPAIVVIDHSLADGVEFDPMNDTFVITLDDWGGLMTSFSSVSATLTYVRRILDARPGLATRLGEEELRFWAVVDADAETVRPDDPTARPWVDGPVDEMSAALFRDLVERVWEYDGEIPWQNADEYRSIVATLDSLPPSSRKRLTRWILDKRRSLEKTGKRAGGLAFAAGVLLVYVCDYIDKYTDREEFVGLLATVAATRREEVAEQTGETAPRTLGIGVLVQRPSEGVAYNYVLIDGEIPALPDEVRQGVYRALGQLDITHGRLVEVDDEPKDHGLPCP